MVLVTMAVFVAIMLVFARFKREMLVWMVGEDAESERALRSGWLRRYLQLEKNTHRLRLRRLHMGTAGA